MRLLITGGPRTGKTTLGGKNARHTDDLIGHLDWSEASAEVAKWFDAAGPWTIEGVAIPRALRKWLESHPEGKPADKIIFLNDPKVELIKGQAAMTKGLLTVWHAIKSDLIARGVEIEYHR